MNSSSWNTLVWLYPFSPWSSWPDGMLEWPSETQLWMVTPGLGNILLDMIYTLNQQLVRRAISLIARIHRSRNQRARNGIAFLTRDELMRFLYPVLMTYDSDNLRHFSFQVKNASTRQHSSGPTKLKLEMATDIFRQLVPANHQAKKGLLYWLGYLIWIIKGKLGCFYTMEVGRSMSGIEREWEFPFWTKDLLYLRFMGEIQISVCVCLCVWEDFFYMAVG